MLEIRPQKVGNHIIVDLREMRFILEFYNFEMTHGITAEVKIFFVAKEKEDEDYKIYGKRYLRGSLFSKEFKKYVADTLAEFVPVDDTQKLTETIFSSVIEKIREIENLHEASSEEQINEINYLYLPFVIEKQPNLIFGEGGTCKSLFVSYLALKLAEKGHNGLYIDYETDFQIWNDRIKRLRMGNDINPKGKLYYYYADAPFEQKIETLIYLTAEKEISFIVIDSLAGACAGQNLNEPEAATSFFNALRQLNTTSIIVSHIAKTEQKKTTPYGSIFYFNFSRNIFETKADFIFDTSQIALTLLHTKSNYSELFPPKGFIISFDKQEIKITELDKFHPLSLRHQPLHIQIKTILERKGLLLVKQIAEELQQPENKIRATLGRYQGILFIKIDKKWGVLDKRLDI
jgi:KaiC/GvpD/RAD55 family RecA-like ATPase